MQLIDTKIKFKLQSFEMKYNQVNRRLVTGKRGQQRCNEADG
jgi:hypothetical protein